MDLPHAISVSQSEVDGLLLVMPFALCAACTTYAWCSMRAAGHFKHDPNWDAELFTDRRLQLYEMLYALETCLLLSALLALTADPGITLTCSDPELDSASGNLAWKAAELFLRQTESRGGACIELHKHIPHGAGLGGGSSDAAAGGGRDRAGSAWTPPSADFRGRSPFASDDEDHDSETIDRLHRALAQLLAGHAAAAGPGRGAARQPAYDRARRARQRPRLTLQFRI